MLSRARMSHGAWAAFEVALDALHKEVFEAGGWVRQVPDLPVVARLEQGEGDDAPAAAAALPGLADFSVGARGKLEATKKVPLPRIA